MNESGFRFIPEKQTVETDERLKTQIKELVIANTPGIVNKTYTVEDLNKDLGRNGKHWPLLRFLRLNFLTSSLAEIAKTLADNKEKSGPSVSEKIFSRAEMEQLKSDVKERIFALYDAGKNRTAVTADIALLANSGQLPEEKVLLQAFKAKTLSALCKNLYSQWDVQRFSRKKLPNSKY